jgi:hypothetical protein
MGRWEGGARASGVRELEALEEAVVVRLKASCQVELVFQAEPNIPHNELGIGF